MNRAANPIQGDEASVLDRKRQNITRGDGYALVIVQDSSNPHGRLVLCKGGKLFDPDDTTVPSELENKGYFGGDGHLFFQSDEGDLENDRVLRKWVSELMKRRIPIEDTVMCEFAINTTATIIDMPEVSDQTAAEEAPAANSDQAAAEEALAPNSDQAAAEEALATNSDDPVTGPEKFAVVFAMTGGVDDGMLGLMRVSKCRQLFGEMIDKSVCADGISRVYLASDAFCDCCGYQETAKRMETRSQPGIASIGWEAIQDFLSTSMYRLGDVVSNGDAFKITAIIVVNAQA